MDEVKSPLSSMTIYASLAMIIIALLNQFGVEGIEHEEVKGLLLNLGAVISAVIAIIGRFRATKRIKVKSKVIK